VRQEVIQPVPSRNRLEDERIRKVEIRIERPKRHDAQGRGVVRPQPVEQYVGHPRQGDRNRQFRGSLPYQDQEASDDGGTDAVRLSVVTAPGEIDVWKDARGRAKDEGGRGQRFAHDEAAEGVTDRTGHHPPYAVSQGLVNQISRKNCDIWPKQAKVVTSPKPL